MRAARSLFFGRQVAAAICLLLLGLAAADVSAQGKRFRPQPRYLELGKPDQAEGRRILEDFRARSLEGDYYLEFSLRVMPRRGAEKTIPGRLWGSRNERGPITRITLQPGVRAAERRLLVQNGPVGAVWGWTASAGASAEASVLGAAAWFEPLAGTDLTAFDLQMPYLYWEDFVFEGVTNLRGRPAHAFILYPPDELAARRPELHGVRVYLDTAYHALVQSEQLGPEGRVLKTMTLLEFKKVDDQWMVKSIDLRDEATRNKTRFLVTAAALGIALPEKIFAPAALAELASPPPADRLRALGR